MIRMPPSPQAPRQLGDGTNVTCEPASCATTGLLAFVAGGALGVFVGANVGAFVGGYHVAKRYSAR